MSRTPLSDRARSPRTGGRGVVQWSLHSRPRAVLIVLVLLFVLDAARSVYARVGYRSPTERWEPSPAQYTNLQWPPGAQLSANAPRDERVYQQRCAVCHGPDGRGNGPAAPSLHPRPRDFTRGVYKYKSTPPTQPPTDADLYQVVANGLQASAMPYWRGVLGDSDIRAVVRYVKRMSPVFSPTAPDSAASSGARSARPRVVATALGVPPRPRPDSASVQRGRRLYATVGCAACHGLDGRQRMRLSDAAGHVVYTRDLSAPWTFRGGAAPEQVWLRLTTGLAPSPMPSFAGQTTAAQRWDVVNYVLSLTRTPPWAPGGRFGGPGTASDPVVRGEYLARAEMCGLCHTMIDTGGIYRADDRWLAGGMRVGAYPQGVFISRNLTSDSVTGIGRFSAPQIARALRDGRSPRGTVLNLWGMPWMLLHALTADDATAIGAFLKTLPPVANHIPDPAHYGVVETIVQKVMRGLPQAAPTMLTYSVGNYGDPPGHMSRAVPLQLLVGAQWLVLAAGLVLLVMAGPRDRRWPHGWGGWLRSTAIVLGLLIAWVVGGIAYGAPALAIIPPDIIGGQFSGGIFRPDTSRIAAPEQRSLVTRGRYLYSVASCALCHGFRGEGGAKVNWAAFGTLYARNISSDSATGVGTWSDAELARAIRSGVSRDGRALHWQAMIWDHASNWDEEDLRAIIAYVRRLPAVHHAVPEPVPPSPADCATYSFWVAPSTAPGCR